MYIYLLIYLVFASLALHYLPFLASPCPHCNLESKELPIY